ncbi:hypothetical protein [Planctomyces sp. SH-PL62]|uniref:hypothetical protein n=1 Tax=Planctomyces sp. SH-PL62 TaxID=1636152 RepID=UPI0008391045|nr:hypothetical protein [Planctomyces sp. SH-PL62]
MRTPRFRFTVLGLTGTVVLLACLAATAVHLRRWQARQDALSLQRLVTRSVMERAREEIAAAGRASPWFRVVYGPDAASRWTDHLEAWEDFDRRGRPLIRVTVSGANHASALAPIRVETYDSELLFPWLDRLLRDYRDRGWRYEVVRLPGAGLLPDAP